MGPPQLEVERPPRLTFDKPVNYVRWYNEQTSRGKTDNALGDYEPILVEPEIGGAQSIEREPIRDLTDEESRQLPKAGMRWKSGDAPLLAAYLENHRTQLTQFERASDHRNYYERFDEERLCLFEIEIRVLRIMRTYSKALMADALHESKANAESIFRAQRVILRSASHAEQTLTTVGGMVSVANQSQVYEHTLASLESGLLNPSDADAQYETFQKFSPGTPNWRGIVAYEWATGLSGMQKACSGGKSTVENWRAFLRRVLPDNPDDPDDGKALTLAAASMNPSRSLGLIEDYYGEFFRIAGEPIRQRNVGRIRKARSQAVTDNLVDSVNDFFCPDLSRAYELTVRVESIRRATMLVLALHIHHEKHGKWPRTLEDIDPKLGLKGLKTYRIDTFSGEPFKYKLKDGRPLLYSVGTDGKDDNGTHHPKWGEGGAGGDYVYWPYQRAKDSGE